MEKYFFLHVDDGETTVVNPQFSFISSEFCLGLSCPPLEPTSNVTMLTVTSLLGFLSPNPWMMLACSPASRCHGSARSWFEVYRDAWMRTTSPSCQYMMPQTKMPKGKVMLGEPAGLKTTSWQSVTRDA